ncbi:MFS transporter [Citrobacter rodentium]|jgi:Arabinose efflux permease|uniref:Major Facilitator Superfamily transporter n=2 Tax=Citrobacter rodentium TaxID=67825 RepID=D2TJH0_CITRI|nr:MFS transporter [Citrobacter rodentium]KIQ49606.1 major facilitator transporter [Citrobacter rodentium]QBY28207.1 MFS transporter [Citrobacter rodentium]UHO29916.1 MHS family MFS transporter [Citrobacter rodentium NBRC 105723 = DSM 16636]CBG88386.1 Major Facilitator Superfamily transporter [Citrobacter rodentium ICC168]HAT8011586.1 MFS transporter [Citrobacter rodentium NBRC 105723 = DSM 16636]
MTTHESSAVILKKNKKVLVASLTGSAIEWFDYFLYGTAAALVFNKIFFPMVDPVIGLILSYLSFSLTFFIRPIGGVIFAHIGDRIGRKKTLVLTLSLMGGATVMIGLLPTYEMIGIWAPVLLILMRIIQGMGIGGEWGGALLLAYEYAPEKRKGFFGSIPQAGVTIGMLMATFIVSLMTLFSEEDFLSWGWRIPFLLSSVLVLLGLWIRRDIDETPDFQKVKQSGQVAKAPLRDTLTHHWREVLIAAGLKVVETAPFYIFSTFVVSYATTTLTYQKSQALEAVTIGALVATVMIPLMGLLSDKVGRKRMYAVSVCLLGLFIVPWFLLLNTGTTWGIMLATVVMFGLLWAPVTAVLGTLCSEIFSANVRYTGITLGYQIGAALAGGTAPLIATGLLAKYDGDWVPVAGYLIVTVVISLIAIFFASRVKRVPAVNAQPNEL